MPLDLVQDPSINKAKQPGGNTSGGNSPSQAPQQATPQAAGPSAAPTVSSGGANKQGTGFTNIQRVLGANTGNQLGNTVAQGITSAGQQLNQDIGKAQEQFGQASEAGRSQYTPDVQNRLHTILANPGSANQSDIDWASGLRTAQYGGPQGLQNANQLQQQAAQAQALGQLAGTQSGRVGLLNQFVGGQGYTSGKQNLDSLLLGLQGGKQVAQARKDVNGLGIQEQSAEQAAAKQANDYAQEAQATGQAVTGSLGQAQTGLQSSVQQQLDTLNKQRGDQYTALQYALQHGGLTADQYKQLDPNADLHGANLYGIDPSKYLTQGGQANIYQAATPQQYASAQALAQMSGQTNTFLPQGTQQQLGAATNFDRTAFENARSGALSGIQQQTNTYAQGSNNQFNQLVAKTPAAQDLLPQLNLGNDPQANLQQLSGVQSQLQQIINTPANPEDANAYQAQQTAYKLLPIITNAMSTNQGQIDRYYSRTL